MKISLLLFFILFANSITSAQFNWEHTDGPEGGSTWYIYNNDDYAYYPDEYYLYRTVDGINWEKIPEPGLWPIATYGEKLVAQAFQGNTFYGIYPRLLKISTDNGSNWSTVNYPQGISSFTSIAWCSHGIYIPRNWQQKLYRSQDEGQTWDTIPIPSQYIYDVYSFNERLYLETGDGFYRTDSNGENWTLLTNPQSGNPIFGGAITGKDDHIIVANDQYIWHSHDDGISWDSVPNPDGIDELALDDNLLVGLGDYSIAYSSDFGISWTPLPASTINLHFLGIATINNTILNASYNHGVYRWDDPSQSFLESNQGIASAAIYELAHDGYNLWAATGNDVSKFDEAAQSWNTNNFLPSVEHYYSNIATGENGLICASPEYGNVVYISLDDGANWDTMDLPPNYWITINDLQIFDDNIFINAEFDGYLRSADFGQTWTQIDVPFSGQSMFKYNDLLMAYSQNSIYTSSDLGSTWDLFSEVNFTSNFYALSSAGDYLVGIANYNIAGENKPRIYTSSDGQNWTYSHDGLPDYEITFFLDEPDKEWFFEHQGQFFNTSNPYGIWASIDTFKTWIPVEQKRFHKYKYANNILYSGGFGGGIIQSEISAVHGDILSGQVFLDENNNGIKEPLEDPLPNISVSLFDPNAWYPFYYINSNENGDYALGITTDSEDTLKPIVHNKYVESINPPYYLSSSGGSNKDFGIYLTPDINDLSVRGHYCQRPRPGFDLSMYVSYKNEGTTDQEAIATLVLDSKLNFLEATPPPTNINGDSLIWDLGDQSVFSSGHIFITTNLPDTTTLGLPLKSSCTIFPISNDFSNADNHHVMIDTVVGSFDPNDKRVEPPLGLTQEEIQAGKELFYTIRFQNTGTYLAEKVRITDMIDTALYIPSLRLVAASHEVTSFSLFQGGLLEVKFDDIMLPDSNSNEPESHGFITFAIQRNKDFNPAYEVKNIAAIYFDFNEPIFTNEVIFTMPQGEPVATKEIINEFKNPLIIFPNPTESSFTISINNSPSEKGMLEISDLSGKVIHKRSVDNISIPIEVQIKDHPQGVYIIKVKISNNLWQSRVVKI